MQNPLASILTGVDADNGPIGTMQTNSTNKLIMKINVHSPTLQNSSTPPLNIDLAGQVDKLATTR